MKVGNSSALDAAFRAQEAAKAAAKEVAKQATAQALKTRDVFSPSPTSRFQQLFGATADGAAATWPKGPLAAGNSKPSADVSTMQSRLVALGFMKDPGTSAGLYGRTTIEATAANPKLRTGSSTSRPAATVAASAANVTGTWIILADASERPRTWAI